MIEETEHTRIAAWVRDVFRLPETTTVLVTGDNVSCDDAAVEPATLLTIKIDAARSYEYSIMKSAASVCYDDILLLKKSAQKFAIENHPFLSKLLRYFGWWFIFAGALTTFSICPVCGQVGCPVGIGTTGIIAGFFTVLKQNGKEWARSVKQRIMTAITGMRNSYKAGN
ncbi:MAG TPA: hypothetical protein PK253_17770 [Spirochaetota bacterium]|nr:hypothetical protein [Spirochaetota bacterium]